MRTENPLFQRFPTQIVPESAHSPEWMPLRASSGGTDARKRRQSRPYWTSDLSNCICNTQIKDILHAMLYRNGGMVRPVLNIVPTFCEIGREIGRDFNGQPVVEPEPQVQLGNGVHTFSLKKRLLVPGYENEFVYYNVTRPHHNYPVRIGLGETSTGPIEYDPIPDLQLFADGVLIPSNLWTCNRDTGEVTVDNSITGFASAMGGFYVLMLMPNKIPMSPKGNGYYEIKSGVALVEPRGGR